MSTVALTYIGVVSPVRVPALGDLPVLDDEGNPRAIERGDTLEVPREVAFGEEPTGEPGDPDFHPGVAGLLAQEANWQRAGVKKETAKRAAKEAAQFEPQTADNGTEQ